MIKHGLEIPLDDIADVCRRYPIRRLALFGSILRDDFAPDSDIDVLVEFLPDRAMSFFKLFDMEEELSAMLGGRKVEINTYKSLSPYFRDEVLAEMEVLYEQG